MPLSAVLGPDVEETRFLLQLARRSIDYFFQNRTLLIPDKREIPQRFLKNGACFVTLTKNENLRGCIGTIIPVRPLYLDVIENAVHAAFHDPRFSELETEEFLHVAIDISILSELTPLHFKNNDDLMNQLDYNTGLLIRYGHRQATFLPSVWKKLPEKQDFIRQLKIKAGIDPEANNLDIDFFTYQVWEISENIKP